MMLKCTVIAKVAFICHLPGLWPKKKLCKLFSTQVNVACKRQVKISVSVTNLYPTAKNVLLKEMYEKRYNAQHGMITRNVPALSFQQLVYFDI